MSFVEWVEQLARTHTRMLTRTAKAEGLSAEDAVDAVQEAFHALLELPQARALFERGEQASPDEAPALLATLVRNVSRNLRRRHHRSQPHEELGFALPIVDEDADLDARIAAAEQRDQLYSCMGQLAEMPKKVVTLRMLEELAGDEVARALGLTPNHVAVLLHRAKKDLLACMCG